MRISKAQNLLRALNGEMPAWTPVECPANPKFGQGAYQFVTYEGALPPQKGGRDLWGTLWQAKTNEQLPYIVGHPVSTIADFASFKFPDINDPALWKTAVAEAASDDAILSIGRQVSSLWERLYFLLGFDKALIALVDEPELVSAALDRIVDWQIEVGVQFTALGVDAVRISDDYGSQDNLLMSPKIWRKLIRPRLARLAGFYHKAGIPVALHSCGNLKLIMDDLVELGFAAFNIQTNANDLPAYKRRYGKKFRLWGGVSTQSVLAAGTPEAIQNAVKEIHTLFGEDGCLILEPDQIVELPEQNLRVFWETASSL